jgi:hypothetical protein
LTSKCVSRHSGEQFLISHLPRWLCTRRFSKPTFRPSGATEHWKKNSVSLLLTVDLSLFWLFFFADCSQLCFSICPYLSEVWLLSFLQKKTYFDIPSWKPA